MSKFLFKILKTFFVIYCTLMILQLLVDFLMSKENSCNNDTWSKIFNGKLTTEVAVLGTSRAETHYNPKLIENSTGFKAYNLGLSGTPYTVLKIRWDAYIKRNLAPKVLILDLDASSLKTTRTLFNKFQYLPYLKTEAYRSFAKEYDSDYYKERFIPLFKYRGTEMKIYRKAKMLFDNSLCSDSYKGHISHDKEWIEKDYQHFKRIMEEDQKRTSYDLSIYNEGFSVLEEIISDCKKNNIKLYFIWSPSYIESHAFEAPYKKYVDSMLTQISLRENIKYVNFSNDSICYNKSNFYNSSHLNSKGATKFTKKISAIVLEN